MKDLEKELAARVGLAGTYTGQLGQTVEVPATTRRAVLAALGFDLSSSRSAAQELRKLEASEKESPPDLLVVEAEKLNTVEWRGPDLKFQIDLEQGGVVEGRAQAGRASIPPLPVGYHRLHGGETGHVTTIISAPAKCYVPPKAAKPGLFGISAQVYSLRRTNDLGIGDLGHVFDLAESCGARGADLLGLSPLHALFPFDRSKVSPYSPSTRFYIDPIFIDPEAIPGARIPAITRTSSISRLVDFPSVWQTKHAALRELWRMEGPSIREQPGFKAYLQKQGEGLMLHATFDALSEHLSQKGFGYSGAWPAAFRNRSSEEVAEFRRDHQEAIGFWCWLQYLADEQLRVAAERARTAGMAFGLYRDLAVGADSFGSEIWSDPQAWCPELSVGAPPDPLGPKGQNWGFPPLNPLHERRHGLLTFRALVTANMRHAGALRIDHAFQLQRLFVIPRGRPAAEGCYLDYPFDGMLAVLRVESHRSKCAVIAEDLGNGPEGFSDRIMQSGIFSYRILSFERNEDGSFRRPDEYPEHSLASINTHDLPTFAGWWRGLDIDLRECFGVYDAQEWEREKSARKAERQALLKALRREGVTATEAPAEKEARYATMRYLAKTRSSLAMVSLEDVCGELNQPNLPGLAAGYPNWQRRLNRTIDEISRPFGDLAKCTATLAREGRGGNASLAIAAEPPMATYRLQLNKAFPFSAAIRVLPQLKRLGVSHIYVSPITTAMAGSTHGYDVTDPAEINPELGGREGFEEFVLALRSAGLQLIVDIVPNHMAAHPSNPLWASVLAEGVASQYARVFDIDWQRHEHGKLVLPILPKPLEIMIQNGEIRLLVTEGGKGIAVDVGQQLPIHPSDAKSLLRQCQADRRKSEDCQAVLDRLCKADPDLVEDLIGRQSWRATYWRSGRSEINYRRFFEIDSLVGVRVEDPTVFETTHRLIFELISEGKIQGLRIDHVDGLVEPKGYLERLQSAVGPGFYIVVEKILGAGESLRDWPVAGTTGYDALVELDSLFLESSAVEKLDALYASVESGGSDPKAMLVDVKAWLTETAFDPELTKLTDLAFAAARSASRWHRDLSWAGVKAVLQDYVANIPVYRTYVDQDGMSPEDEVIIRGTIEGLKTKGRHDSYVIDYFFDLLTFKVQSEAATEFRTRLQQLTGPLMAKGQEDTVFYRYHRQVVMNEVGGDVGHAALSLKEFHGAAQLRQARHPGSLIATTTHDTKRGEDGRARLLALAQHPDWMSHLWTAWQESARRAGTNDISQSDLYMALQNVVAAWPADRDGLLEFEGRIREFLQKALREAKVSSSWTSPDIRYEQMLQDCVAAVIKDPVFMKASGPIRGLVNLHGCWISLARTVVKCTCPGVPDFYQGTETWNFSLVDPDNRRPAPFSIAEGSCGELSDLMPAWANGRVKEELTRRLLRMRAQEAELFSRGSYESMNREDDSWIVFRRMLNDEGMTIAALRKFDASWTDPHLPQQAYDELERLLPFQGQVNVLVAKPGSDGTASSWAELCAGMPFAIMRSAR